MVLLILSTTNCEDNMAYVNQEKKAKIKIALDSVLKNTDIKYTLAVQNNSTIVCTIRKGSVDFISNYRENLSKDHARLRYVDMEREINYINVNHYHLDTQFSGKALEILKKILAALNIDNFDKSDIMSDYFHVGHYVDLNIGNRQKPYQLLEKK